MSAIITPVIGKKDYLNGFLPGFKPGIPVEMQTGTLEKLAKKHSTRVRVRIRLDHVKRAEKAAKIMAETGSGWDKHVLRQVTNGADFVRSSRMLVNALLRELTLTGEVKIPMQYEFDEYSLSMKVEDTLDFKPGEVLELPVRSALLLLDRVPYSLFFEEPGAMPNQGVQLTGASAGSEPLRPGELSKVQEVQARMQKEMDAKDRAHRAEIDELRALIMNRNAVAEPEEPAEPAESAPPKPRGRRRNS